ncbi:Mak10 subunit, NatC N-terminal acetyltransferase-domain-containing protein [Pilobolus umbonatus]|nr:Mak10 subunit, NatC N-terminal acetyltransferase-domain-containing protein [Pilobolus umbonatus]
MQQLNDLEEAYSDLNINIGSKEYLVPQWKDITSFLDEATEDFDTGQLVHLPSFSLFEAMCAIEIMHPRMDTGMITHNRPNTFDINKRLSPAETLGIMDRIVTQEMAWISGHSLSQTVFTCVYFHHIKALSEQSSITINSGSPEIIYNALRTYVVASARCCHYIWSEMSQGNVFEEEDFTSNLFGLSFNITDSDVTTLNDLDTSIKLLHHLNSKQDDPIIQGILHRMQLRKSYLLLLIYLSQTEGSHLNLAKKGALDVKHILQSIDKKSIDYGIELEEAFDATINRKLSSQTPPRPVELISDLDSYAYFSALVDRLLLICDIMHFPSATSLMNFFVQFGTTKPYADAFSRSKLDTIFFHNQLIFGTLPVPKLIISSIEETVRPPVWWLRNKSIPSYINTQEIMRAHKELDSFLERASMAFVEIFKINCHNRPRQRRMLCKIVGEWELIQAEAADVDEIFSKLNPRQEKPYYLSSWAYNIKLSMIEKILFLGFELDLYGLHEYPMIYWYTQTVLSSHAYLLERILNFIDSPEEGAGANAYSYICSQQLIVHAQQNLCAAVLKILIAAKFTNQWKCTLPVFDNEETRFLHRFKSFLPLTSPPQPTYEMFSESIKVVDIDIDALIKMVKHDLGEAKKVLESLMVMEPSGNHTEMIHDAYKEDIKNLIRTSVGNTIGLNHLKTAPEHSLQIVFKYHPWFPLITKI